MTAALNAVWTFLNSPLGITAVAALVLYLLKKARERYPAWMDYEGAIVEAVKFAEKQIPDNHPSRAAARFDAALRYVLRIYDEVNGAAPKKIVVESLKEGVRVKHAELEASGVLTKRELPADE